MITGCTLFVRIITSGCALLLAINGRYGGITIYGDSAILVLTKPFTSIGNQTLMKQMSASFTQF
jgi:hypothetical protein